MPVFCLQFPCNYSCFIHQWDSQGWYSLLLACLSCYCLSDWPHFFLCANVCMCVGNKYEHHTHRLFCLCSIVVSSGVKFCFLKGLPFQVEIVKLASCLSHSQQTQRVCVCVCECPRTQLFLAGLTKPLSPLTPHCHILLRTLTYTHTHTYRRTHAFSLLCS